MGLLVLFGFLIFFSSETLKILKLSMELTEGPWSFARDAHDTEICVYWNCINLI